MYNYWGYDDNCAVYVNPNNPTEPIRSVAWEGIREGQDDLRYVATAEKLISLAPPEARKKASETAPGHPAVTGSVPPSAGTASRGA